MKNEKLSDDHLITEYKEKYPLYEKLCSELIKQLQELISEAEIVTLFPIEYRVKTWKSIYNKCQRNQIKPKKLEEIPDVAGLRIILLFKRDLDKICQIIENNFKIHQKEDTEKRLRTDQFGYGSIHYELAPPESWFSVPTLQRLKGLQAEIQVRTASQHIWATASHLLQYKRESDVPIPIRRSINRAAAILETVDLEFERVLEERWDYLEQINDFDDETLNTDSLRRLLDKIFPEYNKEEPEEYAKLLEELRILNISTVRELEEIIKRNFDETMKEEAIKVSECLDELELCVELEGTTKERTIKGVYFTHSGLLRITFRNEFGNRYHPPVATDDYDLG